MLPSTDLDASFVELRRRQSLDGCLSADRHENRSLHGPMCRVQPARAGSAVGMQKLEAKGHATIVVVVGGTA